LRFCRGFGRNAAALRLSARAFTAIFTFGAANRHYPLHCFADKPS